MRLVALYKCYMPLLLPSLHGYHDYVYPVFYWLVPFCNFCCVLTVCIMLFLLIQLIAYCLLFLSRSAIYLQIVCKNLDNFGSKRKNCFEKHTHVLYYWCNFDLTILVLRTAITKITQRITCFLWQTVGGYKNGYLSRMMVLIKLP